MDNGLADELISLGLTPCSKWLLVDKVREYPRQELRRCSRRKYYALGIRYILSYTFSIRDGLLETTSVQKTD